MQDGLSSGNQSSKRSNNSSRKSQNVGKHSSKNSEADSSFRGRNKAGNLKSKISFFGKKHCKDSKLSKFNDDLEDEISEGSSMSGKIKVKSIKE